LLGGPWGFNIAKKPSFLLLVREATAAHAFFYGYSADEGSANWQLQEVCNFANIVASDLGHASEAIKTSEQAA
jgi:hypothetical protein